MCKTNECIYLNISFTTGGRYSVTIVNMHVLLKGKVHLYFFQSVSESVEAGRRPIHLQICIRLAADGRASYFRSRFIPQTKVTLSNGMPDAGAVRISASGRCAVSGRTTTDARPLCTATSDYGGIHTRVLSCNDNVNYTCTHIHTPTFKLSVSFSIERFGTFVVISVYVNGHVNYVLLLC